MSTSRVASGTGTRRGPTASRWPSGVGRHAALLTAAGALLLMFWASRPEWSADMRLWRAVGDVAVVLLFLSLAVGPAARLNRSLARALLWRRQIGVWAAVTALVHALLILDGWAQWSVRRFLGYEFVPQLGREARLEPGFGLANLLGLVALVWLLALLATSFDRAVRSVGPAAWKWLHGGAYVVFYLVALHSAYFLFMHYTESFHRPPAPENWFRWPLVFLATGVLLLQWAAFVQTARRRRDRSPEGPRPRR